LTYTLALHGVSGSVTAGSHPGALAVSFYDFDVTQPASAVGGGSAGAGQFAPLFVGVAEDTGLAAALALLASGVSVTGATLTARTTGPAPYDVFTLDLEGLVVTRVRDLSGPGYWLTLDYRAFDLTTNGRTDGGLITPESFGWDRAANAPTNAIGDGAEPVVAASLPDRYFLLVDGVDGGSSDPAHKGWFEVASFFFDASAPWSATAASGSAGQPAFGPLEISLYPYSGLTELVRRTADGTHLKGVRLQGVTATGTAVYDLRLSDVVVQATLDSSFPGESLTLDYRTIELSTRGEVGGTSVETSAFAFDRATNAPPISPAPTLAPGNAPGEGTTGFVEYTYFLALDGVAGNSTDISHPGALTVAGYEFRATQTGAAVGGGSANVSSFAPLVVTVTNDAALAQVLSLLISGQTVSGATLTARAPGAQPLDVYKLDLEDVTVTAVETWDFGKAFYRVTLGYKEFDLTTTARTATGTPATEGTFGWNPSTARPADAVGDGAEATAPGLPPLTYFLLVDGIDGGSTDVRHPGWFDVSEFSIDWSRAAAGAMDFETLSVNLAQLGGLPALQHVLASGTHLRGVRLEGMSAGPNPLALYDLTLSDVIVRRVSEAYNRDSVAFDYASFELITRGHNNFGAVVQTGAIGFDRATGTAFTPTGLPSLAPGSAPGDGTPRPSSFTRSHLIVSGVSGDVTDEDHPGALPVFSYGFESTQSGTVVGTGGGGAGVPTFGPLTLQVTHDTGLAGFLSLLASGHHVPAASLMVPAEIGPPHDAYRLDLGDVSVLAVEDLAFTGYNLTLGYRQIEVTTTGLAGQSVPVTTGSFGWDTLAGTIASVPGDVAEPVVAETLPGRYFLLIDGVDGGSTDPGHAGWFTVIGHQLKTSRAAGTGGPTFGTLSATFNQDTGLTVLLQRAAAGTHLKGVRLEGLASDIAVYDLTLSNVVVRQVEEESNRGYTVEFDYSRVELITRGQNNVGAVVQTGAFGFDVASGTAFAPTGLPALSPFSVAAHDDSYVVLQGQALSIGAALGVLANDDVSAGATVSLRAGPLHGTLQLAANGGFSYTPAAGFSGIDSFAYRVASVAGTTSDGEVQVQIVPVNVGASTTLNLVVLTPEQQIASTYAAFFGRAADALGFAFWVDQFHIGLPTQGAATLFANIASSFGISIEAKTLYPFLASPSGASDGQIGTFLDSVYNNLFNRSSDAAGLAYWTGQVRATLQAGQFVGSVLVDIMSGAQDSAAGKDITTLMGKVAVSLAYVHEQQVHNTVWAGASDVAQATDLLRSVTSDPSSVLVGIRNAEALIAAHA